MENITNAQIHSQMQRAQAEGGTSAAQKFGAAASGKADEEQHKLEESSEPEEQVEINASSPQSAESDVNTTEKAPDAGDAAETEERLPSREEILGQDGSISEESLRNAEAIVTHQIKDPEQSKELSKRKPLGEPKLLELRLEESIKMMDIHDLYSCKPLPPIMDDEPPISEDGQA